MAFAPAAATAATMAFAPAASAATMEERILAEVNFARAYPQAYALRLLVEPQTSWERALADAGTEADDPGAFGEAVEHLLAQAPLPPLEANKVLAAAALEHVALQGPVGAIGHSGPDGERFYDRIRRHGAGRVIAAENIAYGPPAASDVVRALIIDSGVASRGHRRNIFHDGFEAVGVSCGPHRDYSTMCVMDFSGAPSRMAARGRQGRSAAE
jgi:uncharacterized protein YkwD